MDRGGNPMNAFEKFRKDVKERISKASRIKGKVIVLEKPRDHKFGDLAFPCFVLSKKLRKPPHEIAKDLSSKIRPSGLIAKIGPKGGYLNFFAEWGKIGQDVIKEVLKEKGRYGSGKGGIKILVEHTSANPDGPLHLGHFRNSVIGDSLAKILSFAGNRVKTDFLVNDTGRQIAIAVMEYMKKQPKAKGKPDWWVLNLYLKGNKEVKSNGNLEEELKKIMQDFEKGDKTLRKHFTFITQKCLEGHRETFGRLGIKVDNYSPESKYIFNGDVWKILGRVKKTKNARIDGKRVWVDLKKFGIEREFNLTRSDGTSMYTLRDLAYHKYKLSQADFNINVMGGDQKLYFDQIVSTLKLIMPEKAEKYEILFYEFLKLPGGSMSTREGKFVSVDELMKKAVENAIKTVSEKMPNYTKREKKEIAEKVGVGALKYAMIKVSPEKTYAFSIEDALSFEGNNAPYLQYTYARANSILSKANVRDIKNFDISLLKHPIERDLVKMLSEFPEAVRNASNDLRPHYVANYCYNLSTKFNEFYQFMPVIHARLGLKIHRLALVKAVSIVLKNGLNLLGIEAPERM
jgi:arginyl-tRNA synthetase